MIALGVTLAGWYRILAASGIQQTAGQLAKGQCVEFAMADSVRQLFDLLSGLGQQQCFFRLQVLQQHANHGGFADSGQPLEVDMLVQLVAQLVEGAKLLFGYCFVAGWRRDGAVEGVQGRAMATAKGKIPVAVSGKIILCGHLVCRSEERRVGKECRSRWARVHEKKKKMS